MLVRGVTLKRLTVKKDVECMACLSCVVACSQAFYKEFHQDKSCIRIVENNGIVKPVTCIQCGKCARECPQGAITQNAKGVYVINKKLCIGCGRCKEVCPMGVCLKPDDSETASKCIACGICAKACPMDVLEVVEC